MAVKSRKMYFQLYVLRPGEKKFKKLGRFSGDQFAACVFAKNHQANHYPNCTIRMSRIETTVTENRVAEFEPESEGGGK